MPSSLRNIIDGNSLLIVIHRYLIYRSIWSAAAATCRHASASTAAAHVAYTPTPPSRNHVSGFLVTLQSSGITASGSGCLVFILAVASVSNLARCPARQSREPSPTSACYMAPQVDSGRLCILFFRLVLSTSLLHCILPVKKTSC